MLFWGDKSYLLFSSKNSPAKYKEPQMMILAGLAELWLVIIFCIAWEKLFAEVDFIFSCLDIFAI